MLKTYKDLLTDMALIQASSNLLVLLLAASERLRTCRSEMEWREAIDLVEKARQDSTSFLIRIGKEWDR